MNTRLTRHDLSYLVSAVLLAAATITATTGLVSELWDLNDFVYHKYAAYTLVFIGLSHIFLHWGRLVSYLRWRMRKHRKRRRIQSPIPTQSTHQQQKTRQTTEESENSPSTQPVEVNYASLSRRDFIGLVIGGLGGFALGRFLRPEPDLPYAVKDHALELLRADDLRGEIVRYGLMQEFLGQANLVLVFTAFLQRLRWKYQERTYRYALIEAGHLGQNVYLAATSMGMGACAVGAFLDDNLNTILEVDGRNEAAIYLLSVGKVRTIGK